MDRFTLNRNKLVDAGFEVDAMHLHLPGLQREYHFVFLCDLHILLPNGEVSPDWTETVDHRFSRWALDRQGAHAADLWLKMADTLSALQLDALLLGGDMIDYYSTPNMERFKEGLSRLSLPVLYMRDNHDRSNLYSSCIPETTILAAHNALMDNSPLLTLEYDDLLVVGLNNSDEDISCETLTHWKALLQKNKPILLATHIPFAPKEDEGLTEAALKVWFDKLFLRGVNDRYYHTAKGETAEFLQTLYREENPVFAVAAGHLHLCYEGPISENTVQHVFDAAFKGTVGYIHVCGE